MARQGPVVFADGAACGSSYSLFSDMSLSEILAAIFICFSERWNIDDGRREGGHKGKGETPKNLNRFQQQLGSLTWH
jgi:hypothetical protein